jgi:Carboxypeptidase regulatory-like domain/PDZ domain
VPAIACAAMLVLPLATWLFAPRPPTLALPPQPSVVLAAPEPAPEPSSPHARSAVRPVRAVTSSEPADGPVTGVVLDPDGRPVKGAFVGCDDRDQALATSTDEEGAFKLAPEAAGCVALARHADFVESDKVTLSGSRANTLHLNRAGGIEGEVVDERGGPIASYLIAVESYQGPSAESAPTGQTKSIQDPRGAFAWEKLVPGRYVLTASAGGRPPAQSSPIEVDVGRVTAHVRITLARGATLAGRVLDAVTRKPIAGALIAFDRTTNTRADTSGTARSDERGAYSLEGAPAGPFSIRVVREGYRTRTVTGLTARGAPTVQQDVELNPAVDGGPNGEDFAGIGAFLAPSPAGVTFSGVLPGGPAEQAGLQSGDLIRRIDGADASSFTTADCMQRLRGPDGSRVTVQVERGGQRVEVAVQRRALTL